MNDDEQNEMEALEDEIVEMEDRLKRYREALERIADHNIYGFTSQTEVAQEALGLDV